MAAGAKGRGLPRREPQTQNYVNLSPLQMSWERHVSKAPNLQDLLLNTLRKERVPVAIFLKNGIKLQGTIESFDQYVVMLKNVATQVG